MHATHIGSQFQQHLDSMALSSSGCSMEWGIVLLVLHIHISFTTNQGVDAVSVACVCVHGGGGRGEGSAFVNSMLVNTSLW